MKALLVIDAQNGIVNHKDFTGELKRMDSIIGDFKGRGRPVIFMRHFDEVEESPLYRDSKGSEIHESLRGYADYVFEKTTPSSFYKTKLEETLRILGVSHLFITGFNTEFCCTFTAISAFDRGYKVTFIEDATGTVNSGETYEMNDLDIPDFIGTVLHWSETMEVLDHEEYVEAYLDTNSI